MLVMVCCTIHHIAGIVGADLDNGDKMQESQGIALAIQQLFTNATITGVSSTRMHTDSTAVLSTVRREWRSVGTEPHALPEKRDISTYLSCKQLNTPDTCMQQGNLIDLQSVEYNFKAQIQEERLFIARCQIAKKFSAEKRSTCSIHSVA